jgi:septal ring factor EnvC (AmiA/AmiB activator)
LAGHSGNPFASLKHAGNLAQINCGHHNHREEMRVLLSVTLVFVCLGSIGGVAQNTPDGAEDLARMSRELRETRSELAESRRQIEELRQGLQELRNQVQASHPPGIEPPKFG